MPHVTIILNPCRVSLSPMSHVEFKKSPCCPVDFRSLGPYMSPQPGKHKMRVLFFHGYISTASSGTHCQLQLSFTHSSLSRNCTIPPVNGPFGSQQLFGSSSRPLLDAATICCRRINSGSCGEVGSGCLVMASNCMFYLIADTNGHTGPTSLRLPLTRVFNLFKTLGRWSYSWIKSTIYLDTLNAVVNH